MNKIADKAELHNTLRNLLRRRGYTLIICDDPIETCEHLENMLHVEGVHYTRKHSILETVDRKFLVHNHCIIQERLQGHCFDSILILEYVSLSNEDVHFLKSRIR